MEIDKLTYEIEPGFLYGRPGPNKSLWHLDGMKKAGIKVILSLVSNPTRQEVEKAGLIHYQLPFEDKIYRPYKTANQHVLEILKKFDEIIDKHLDRREAILVHCNSGKDRTGLLLVYYLVSRKGLNSKRAISEIKKLKPTALSAKGYEDIAYAIEPWMKERRSQILM